MNRFDRVTAILIQLQAKRKVSGAALAEQFGVSVRTLYRDLRTLAEAGVPLPGEPGIGYSLAKGYRLPPVMFTREEAVALLTAEKLAARLTDAPTAHLSAAAMDKFRVMLRGPDHDHLDTLAPHIQVLPPRDQAGRPPAYQQLVAPITTHRVVHLCYQAADNEAPTTRDIEPLTLYLSRQWHVVAYCRLRQTIRTFRLDRVQALELRPEVFTVRSDRLQQHWAAEATRRPRERVMPRFQPVLAGRDAARLGPAPARHQAPVRLGPRAAPAHPRLPHQATYPLQNQLGAAGAFRPPRPGHLSPHDLPGWSLPAQIRIQSLSSPINRS